MKMYSKFILSTLLIITCITQVQAWSYFYSEPVVVVYPAPVVYQQSAGEAVATGVLALGACVGLGVSAIVKHRAKKRKLREYSKMFQGMGYNQAQAKIYAQMAVETDGGFQAVVNHIEHKQESYREFNAQKKLMETSHQLQLWHYLVLMLAAAGLGFLGLLCFRRFK